MNRCKDCKCWPEQEGRESRHPSDIMDDGKWAMARPDAEIGPKVVSTICPFYATGPEFGCVNFETKET